MKKSTFFPGFLAIILLAIFTTCKHDDVFRIESAKFNKDFVPGTSKETAQANDLTIDWKGDVKFPLKVLFYPQNAPAGDYEKGELIIDKPQSPIFIKDFYRFWGNIKDTEMVYMVQLEENQASGKKTTPYEMHLKIVQHQ